LCFRSYRDKKVVDDNIAFFVRTSGATVHDSNEQNTLLGVY
jgi:hypothetical protein